MKKYHLKYNLRCAKSGDIGLDKQMCDQVEKYVDKYLNSTDDMSDSDWREDFHWLMNFMS